MINSKCYSKNSTTGNLLINVLYRYIVQINSMIKLRMIFVRIPRSPSLNCEYYNSEVAARYHYFINLKLRRIERTQTDTRSQVVYSSNLWNPCTKKSIPVNHRKKVRNIPLYGLLGFLRGAGYFALASENLSLFCLISAYFSNYSCCILIDLLYNKQQKNLVPSLISHIFAKFKL